MKRSLIKALATTAIAGLIGVAAAAPATADPTTVWVAPVMSWDGTAGSWEQNPLEPMFSTDAMVPADRVQAGIYVKNDGTRKARLKIVLRDVRIPAAKQAVLDAVAALPAGTQPTPQQLAVTQLYDEVHLRTEVGSASVDDTIPNLAALNADIVLFDADVDPGQQAAVSAWYDWIYAGALTENTYAGNGVEGPWMDFTVVATMYYVEEPPTSEPPTSQPPSTTAAPTSTPAPSDTVIPPTTVTVTTTDSIDVGGVGQTRPAGGGGGDLPSTGLGTPVMALGLTGLVLLALGLPLILRRRKDKRSHA